MFGCVGEARRHGGTKARRCAAAAVAGLTAFTGGVTAQTQPADDAPTSSLIVQAEQLAVPEDTEPHALRSVSLFAVSTPEDRIFQRHDLIQIIVRETSRARSKHELETDKETKLNGRISAWPDIRLDELLQFQVRAGRTTNLPSLNAQFSKEFEGEGEYKRQDDLTARLTAEVVEVLPNGNLILEGRTRIKTDEEESVIKITGICRPEDVTPANTILSGQLHDLKVEKNHRGQLKKANRKGILTRFFEAIFAF